MQKIMCVCPRKSKSRSFEEAYHNKIIRIIVIMSLRLTRFFVSRKETLRRQDIYLCRFKIGGNLKISSVGQVNLQTPGHVRAQLFLVTMTLVWCTGAESISKRATKNFHAAKSSVLTKIIDPLTTV